MEAEQVTLRRLCKSQILLLEVPTGGVLPLVSSDVNHLKICPETAGLGTAHASGYSPFLLVDQY